MHQVIHYAEFAEQLGRRRTEVAEAAPPLLRRLGEALPRHASALATETSHVLRGTIADLDAAEAELRAQNEDLFAARTELEAQGQLYHDFFEHAPVPYIVTDPVALIRYVNRAAIELLGRPVNALVGHPLTAYVELGERVAFRAGLARAVASGALEEWPVLLESRGREPVEVQIVARAVATPFDGGTSIYWMLLPTVGGDADLL